ncbi:MAG: DNA polymerase III subunit delta [Alphaproteobacteria bacterium]|nr:DNA polymerase III subunit delta [Alphaproteobacteria bacterium]
MKLSGRQIAGFLRNALPPDLLAVVLYGPDEGQVRERARLLAGKTVEDIQDPFRVATLSGMDLKADPALLADEAAAISLAGGKRLVRLRSAGDDCTTALKAVLDGPAADALIVVEAGELTPRSTLRRLAESHDRAAALPCYADDENAVSRLIEHTVRNSGARIEPDALAFAVSHLGNDRATTRMEAEKLALFAGEGGTIALEDAVACIGDSAALSLDDIAFAAGAGDLAGLSTALDRAAAEATASVTILRAAGRHFQRLDAVQTLVAGGMDARTAMARLRPPVFFRRQAAFRSQLRRWPQGRILAALARLNRAEIECKTTGLPDRAIAERVLIELAGAGAQAAPAMARKSAAERLAPPTSAPSTSQGARSAAALSGLTEPP